MKPDALGTTDIAAMGICFKTGMSQTELARKFGVSQSAVCAAVQNGQNIVKEAQFLYSDASPISANLSPLLRKVN